MLLIWTVNVCDEMTWKDIIAPCATIVAAEDASKRAEKWVN